MESASELEQLEKMVADAKRMCEIRELQRKAAIAEMTRPWSKEELESAEQIVEMAKENVRLRNLYRKRRRELHIQHLRILCNVPSSYIRKIPRFLWAEVAPSR
jgi:hypothetical protein